MKIIFTGGGTAGHVLPNFPLIERFIDSNWEIEYIGSKDGIEKNLINKNFPHINYHGITCDKFRRYFTYKHFLMPFRLYYGFLEALFLIKKLKPDIIFSKGGFVSVSVVLSAWILRIPVVIHESDYSIGLANKLAFPFAKLIAVSFKKSLYDEKYQNKIIEIGPLIRKSFLECKTDLNISFSNKNKKTILIIGGSLGAKNINDLIYKNLEELADKFNIIHICGKNNLPIDTKENYKVFEYLNDGLSYCLSIADLVISRAGINSIWEILIMKKPNILIPLSLKQSRGDQIENANYFHNLGLSEIIQDNDLNLEILNKTINTIFSKNIKYLDINLGDEILYNQIIKLATKS